MRARDALGAAALLAALLIAIPMTSRGRTAPLKGGASSTDDLIERLLVSLKNNDAAALRGLRVTQDEYLRVILPGSVKPGEPVRHWPDDASQYFWGQLDAKSIYSEEALLQLFGGHTYRVKAVRWDKGTQQYATYQAYKQLRLDLVGEDGQEAHLETGSIAEVDGRFKFISFRRD